MSSRRTFLKVGVGASLLLAAGGAVYRATRPAAPAQRFKLDGDARAALAAIVPVLLDGAMPARGSGDASLDAVLARVVAAIAGLPLSSQQDVQDLFGLLALAPARRLLAGIDSWSGAAPADVARFLQDWRISRFGLLRTAYAALHDLVIGAWYADPVSWSAIGYPGPLPALAAP